MRRFSLLCLAGLIAVSCEILDDNIDKHTSNRAAVPLSEVAQVLANIPLGADQMSEVFGAVSSSSENGYDEEYMMYDLFGTPGAGVGDDRLPLSKAPVLSGVPLRDMIADYVKSQAATKSASGIEDPSEWLDRLAESDVQIYWPFSESWDGEELPVITFDPEDDSDVNIGYRITEDSEGFRRIEEVFVDENVAMETPVWVVNRNTDAGYTTLEMLRREDPDWGEGGGSIIVSPGSASISSSGQQPCSKAQSGNTVRSLILKDFTMNRNYDSWFAGASEFFVKVGAFEDFTASTEAELRLFTPSITDFLIVVRRNQKGIPVPFNAMVFSEWTDLVESFAFMIIEDDGGTIKEWNATAFVRVESKSYGVELKIPFHSYDDIVWRGTLGSKWFEAYSDTKGHFGDVDLTFEVVER
ncbi:MAG: hypothetical protein IKV05_00130 [Bacteroidales bacterium]|nr:hypothetical protein [Bacteroidales bacterium]